MADEKTSPASTPTKSWSEKLKSTEFWLSIAAIVFGALVGAGFIGDGTIYSKVGGLIITTLGTLGYTAASTLASLAMVDGKPGFKTSKFWVTVAGSILVWIQGHSVIPEGSQWVGILDSILAVLPVAGYGVARGAVKNAAAKAAQVPLFAGTLDLAPPSGSPVPSDPAK